MLGQFPVKIKNAPEPSLSYHQPFPDTTERMPGGINQL
jgi:hypothetical protein